MKYMLLFITAGLLAFIVFIYIRDTRTINKARIVVSSINQFCRDNGRLPRKEEFETLFPELAHSPDWFYWLMPDNTEVRIQYPMSWARSSAPGSPRISEFTATTYAYVVSIECKGRYIQN